MDNQREENLDLCSDEQLEQLIKNIHNEIKKIKQKIVPIKSEQMKRKLIKLLKLTREDLTNVTNFKLFCKLDKSHGTRDEYAHTYSGKLELSYDYNQEQSEKVSVILNASYLEEQTYYNHHEPDREINSYVHVSGANKSEYEYFENLEVNRVNEDGEEIECNNTQWNYLINEVLGYISEEPENWYYLMDNIVI